MKTFFITRFSIYDHNYHGYKITRNNNNKTYQKLLFSKERMDFKFNVFENVTLKSVLLQKNPNWEWHIYFSSKLEKEYSNKLFTLTTDYENIKICPVDNFEEFFKKVEKYDYGKNYATARLDDDDAISTQYINLLNDYSEYKGRIISFPYGQEYSLKKNKINIGIKCRKPNIAIGLAAINKDIYSCGDHDYIAKNHVVLYDLTQDMYLICCSPFSDTKRKRTKKRKFVLKTYINQLLNKYEHHITKTNTESSPNIFYESKNTHSKIFKLINFILNLIGFQILKRK